MNRPKKVDNVRFAVYKSTKLSGKGHQVPFLICTQKQPWPRGLLLCVMSFSVGLGEIGGGEEEKRCAAAHFRKKIRQNSFVYP